MPIDTRSGIHGRLNAKIVSVTPRTSSRIRRAVNTQKITEATIVMVSLLLGVRPPAGRRTDGA